MNSLINRYIFTALLFFPVLLCAQVTIVGRVVIQNGEPVSEVHILCVESGEGTVSDSLGYFELDCNLPCSLEFSHVNYIKEICRIKNHESPFVIVLRNKFNNLREVIITGRATPGRIHSSQKGIEMIPAILGEQDILKYLATTPGIISANALDPGIYVRGGNSYDNEFLINGMSIINPEHLTGILSTFDPYVLSNSTIYKSGFPARYNSYLSSYIDMRANSGNKQKYEGEATLGLVSSGLKVKGPILKDHTSFIASIRTSYLQSIAKIYNKSVKGTTGQQSIPEYSFNDVTLSIDSKFSNKWRITAFGLFTIDGLDMRLSESVQHTFDWNTFSCNTSIYYNPDAKNALCFQTGINTAFSEGNAEGSIPMGGGNRRYTIINRFSYTHTLSENLQFGLGGKFESARFETAKRMDEMDNVLIRSSDQKFDLSEIYADLTYQISKHFAAYGGINYQFYNGNSKISSISPRAKISFLSGGFTLWVDYAKTVQYLSLYPYFTVRTPVDIWYPLGKNMKPATCDQFSVGIGEEIGAAVSLYAGLFHKNMKNVKDFSSGITTEYTALTDNMINGKGHAKGIELNAAYVGERLNIRMNYTLSESKRTFAEINNGHPFNPPYDIKHNGVFNSSWRINTKLTLNTLWTFSSGTYTTFPVGVAVAHNITDSENKPILIPVYTDRYNYKLPDNHRLDANLDYTIHHKKIAVKVSIGAYNIYNQANSSFVYFNPETNELKQTKFIPKSKVILPFIPYISLRLKW